MHTQELSNIPVHEEITFFQSLLNTTKSILLLMERRNGQPIDDLIDVFYAPSKGKQRTWDDIYLIREEWESFRQYFMGKAPMLYYFEPPMTGLVNKEGVFWVFPNFEQLKNMCFREQIKIHEMNPKAVKKLPFQNLEQHFQKAISNILNDESKVYSMRAQECEKFLRLAHHYMPKKQANEVLHLSRVLLKVGLHQEIEDMIRMLTEKVMTDMTKLKKRMRAVHTLSMKYYFFKSSDEEKRKIDCLVGRDKGSQLAALKYIEMKVARSFNIAREAKTLQQAVQK